MRASLLANRISLVRQLAYPDPGYRPKMLGILLNRDCVPGSCRMCAAGSTRKSTARLSRDQISQVMAQAPAVGITRFSLSGGEPFVRPDEVFFAIQTGCAEGLAICFVLTNGFFAADQVRSREILERLARVWTRPYRPNGFLPADALAVSLDSWHNRRGGIPLGNLVNLAEAYRQSFADFTLHIFQMFEPDALKLQDEFVGRLEQVGVLSGRERTYWRKYEDYRGFSARMRTEINLTYQDVPLRHLSVAGSYDALTVSNALKKAHVRGGIITGEDGNFFYQVASGRICFSLSSISRINRGDNPHLRQGRPPLGNTLLLQGVNRRLQGEIYLGWDGKFYPGPEYAYTGLLPLGRGEEGLDKAIDFAWNDPICRVLRAYGVGYLLNVARQVDPGLAGIEKTYFGVSDLALFLVADPQRALAITRYLIREDLEDGVLPAEFGRLLGESVSVKANPRIRNSAEARAALRALFALDWTGRENICLTHLDHYFKWLSKEEQLQILSDQDIRGLEGVWLKHRLGLTEGWGYRAPILRQLQNTPALCEKAVNVSPFKYAPCLTEKYGRILHRILNGESDAVLAELSGITTETEAQVMRDLFLLLLKLNLPEHVSGLLTRLKESYLYDALLQMVDPNDVGEPSGILLDVEISAALSA